MRSILSLILLVVVAAADLSAQRLAMTPDYLASGPYLVAGAGAGASSGTCDLCGEWGGSGLGLRSGIGWRFSERFAIELDVEGITRTEGSTLEYDVHVSGGIQVRTWRMLSIRAGVGPATVRQEVSTPGGATILDGTSLGWVLGAAYEVPMGRKFTLAPYLNYRIFSATDLERGGAVVTEGYSTSALDLGVALNWSLRSLIWPSERDKGPE